MNADALNWLVLLLGASCAFLLSRWIASSWRKRRQKEAETTARAGESRQVRRARERKQQR